MMWLILCIALVLSVLIGTILAADRRATGVWQWPRELTVRWWKEGWWR